MNLFLFTEFDNTEHVAGEANLAIESAIDMAFAARNYILYINKLQQSKENYKCFRCGSGKYLSNTGIRCVSFAN